MEVADQWRREWAGTAEYGKVTEGGVTRRVARAMEVLHASAPGANVRVLRAAYHSSAGPGAPASSYMLHSSRRVISSGFNFLESPTSNKPLELCSMPLESPEPNGDTHNYKVTEPDDIEISEPSKWRGSTGTNSVRMPSEESSSTDNASIIDLTSNKHLLRKYSYDSENSDIQWGKKGSARASPLLDTPVTLSTLKYKSLLNGSTEWNNRRKSYSFEDTSPLNESILHSNDTLAMESSTDSGICKSSEIVNDHINENAHLKHTDREERRSLSQDESFRDWLYKNRQNSYKRNNFKTPREHDTVIESPAENNIRLQSTGKVSITLPISIETEDDYQYKKNVSIEESDRKVKRVEFCKTEVHFAAESGKVNIIATDEKPPPSNDFRKRRSAFVPMNEILDKHITLFGEKNKDFYDSHPNSNLLETSNGEFGETDENTAATKSILKNKIPKPKPYLLGENMALGFANDNSNDEHSNKDSTVLTAVSLINRQLQTGKIMTPPLTRKNDQKTANDHLLRTIDEGPSKNEDLHAINMNGQMRKFDSNVDFPKKNRFKDVPKSPTQARVKTRQLRESDLTYFGVDNSTKHTTDIIKDKFASRDSSVEEIFRSVRLIQQVSNSVCNSEAESEDSHDYQNVPINSNYTPIPTPRRSAIRSKYDDKPNEIYEIQMLNPILEQDNSVVKDTNVPTPRRSKLRKYEEKISTSRSISEPPKNNSRYKFPSKSSHRNDHPLRGSKNLALNAHEKVNGLHSNKTKVSDRKPVGGDEPPIYENIDIEPEKSHSISKRAGSSVNTADKVEHRRSRNTLENNKNENNSDAKKSHRSRSSNDSSKIQSFSRTSQDDKNIYHIKLKPTITPNSDTKNFTPIAKITDKIPRENETKLSSRSVEKSDENALIVNRNASKPFKNDSTRHNITSATKGSKVSTVSKSDNKKPDMSSLKRTDDNKNMGRSLIHKNSPKKVSPNVVQNLDPNRSIEDPNSIKLKSSDKKSTHKDSTNGHIPKRSEYVINYDDKNGTVSSIRKIKTGPISPKKKRNPKEILKESPKENTVRNKAFDKVVARK